MKTSSMIRPLAAAAVLCAVAGPNFAATPESVAYCDLARNQAEVRSDLLGSAQAFVSVAPSSANRSALDVGVRKSLAGMRQARLVNEIAGVECDAYAAGHELDNALDGLEARIERQVQAVRKAALQKALSQAEQNLAFEQKALASQVATWGDVRGALDARDLVAQTIRTLDESLARLSVMPDPGPVNVRQTLSQSVEAQGRVAALRSRLEATSAWDLQLEAGMRHEFVTGLQSPYVGFVLTRSFGVGRASAAAQETGRLATAYVRAQQQGGAQSYARKLAEMRAVHEGQAAALEGLKQRLALLETARQQVSGVTTTAALRMARNLATEVLQEEAEKVAVETRQQLLGAWLAEQEGTPK